MSEFNISGCDEIMKNTKSKTARAIYTRCGSIDTRLGILMDRDFSLCSDLENQAKEIKQLKGMVGDLIQHQKAVEKYLERINSQLSVDPEPEVIQADSFLKEAALETISAHEIFAKDTADGFERLEAMMIWKYIRDAVEGR